MKGFTCPSILEDLAERQLPRRPPDQNKHELFAFAILLRHSAHLRKICANSVAVPFCVF